MFIKSKGSMALITKEANYNILLQASVLFFAALYITINSRNNDHATIASLFVVGPLLMVISMLIAISFFKIVTITFDRENNTITREVRKINKKNINIVPLDGMSGVEATISEAKSLLIFSKSKYNLFLKFDDSQFLKINMKELNYKKSGVIGLLISDFLYVPFSRVAKYLK